MASSSFISTEEKLSSATKNINSTISSTKDDDEKAATELMTLCYMPTVLGSIIWDYVEDDIDTQADNEVKPLPQKQRSQLTLFGKNFFDVIAQRAATLILTAEEKEVTEAIILIKKNPSLLTRSEIAKDHKGRAVKGNLLQIAAMAGDVNLQENVEGIDRGIVEMIVAECKLTLDETKKQLEVVASEEAKQINEARNQRVLKAVKAFGENIIKKFAEVKEEKELSLRTLQEHCKVFIDKLEKDLQTNLHEVITAGFIFDPAILYETTKWFEENVARFSGWWSLVSDVFWVNAIGKIQANLSARDAQVIKDGIASFVDDRKMPARTLKDSTGKSDFSSSSSLGVSFYIGYYGRGIWRAAHMHLGRRMCGLAAVADLMSGKNRSLTKLMRQSDNASKQRCLIM